MAIAHRVQKAAWEGSHPTPRRTIERAVRGPRSRVSASVTPHFSATATRSTRAVWRPLRRAVERSPDASPIVSRLAPSTSMQGCKAQLSSILHHSRCSPPPSSPSLLWRRHPPPPRRGPVVEPRLEARYRSKQVPRDMRRRPDRHTPTAPSSACKSCWWTLTQRDPRQPAVLVQVLGEPEGSCRTGSPGRATPPTGPSPG